ncbi:MAG: hypothetical protein JWQ98_349 [Chlorobi bacterium]|nr:hypothetical protein [Chlorobiota bacterium]
MNSSYDLFCPGAILKINQYDFEDGGPPRDKYLIGLCSNDNELIYIYSLTTSQNPRNVTPNASGCNVASGLPYWYFTPGDELDANGFTFNLPTYVFFYNNVRKHEFADLERMGKSGSQLGAVKLAQLSEQALKRLLKCALKAERFIARDLLPYLRTAKELLSTGSVKS